MLGHDIDIPTVRTNQNFFHYGLVLILKKVLFDYVLIGECSLRIEIHIFKRHGKSF